MKKKQLAMILEYIDEHQDAVFAEFAQKNFERDGRFKVGPKHKKLNMLRRKLHESCEDVGLLSAVFEFVKVKWYALMLRIK